MEHLKIEQKSLRWKFTSLKNYVFDFIKFQFLQFMQLLFKKMGLQNCMVVNIALDFFYNEHT
jgi:hypothetical protein